jgi:hypothetical protein
MAPYALPDAFAAVLFAASVAALLAGKMVAIKLMALGTCLGMLRERFLRWLGYATAL